MMNKEFFLYSGVQLLGVFVGSLSQVLLKSSALKSHSTLIKEYANPFVISAYILYLMAACISIVSYRVIPFSMGPILEATGYIYITIWGMLFFEERITRKKLLGLCFILIGITIFTVFG